MDYIKINEENKISKYKKCLNKINTSIITKLFYYILHLSLLSFFENIFYFYYISDQEDKGISNNILSITKDIGKNCIYLPLDIRLLIIDYINNNFNITQYNLAYNDRSIQNKQLFFYSMNYLYVFISITMLVLFLLVIKKEFIKIKEVIFDTVIIFGIFTLYEYIFFTKIIINYLPIDTYELEYLSTNQLKLSCSN